MSLRKRIKELTLNEVISAAEKILAEKGFAASDMNSIAKAAGVSVGTLYNYFPDREHLISHILHSHREALLSSADEQFKKHKNKDFLTRLRSHILTVYSYFAEHPAFMKIIFNSDVILPKKLKHKGKEPGTVNRTSIQDEMNTYLADIITCGIKEELVEPKSETYAPVVLGAYMRGLLIHNLKNEKLDIATDIEIVVDGFLNGVGKRKVKQ